MAIRSIAWPRRPGPCSHAAPAGSPRARTSPGSRRLADQNRDLGELGRGRAQEPPVARDELVVPVLAARPEPAAAPRAARSRRSARPGSARRSRRAGSRPGRPRSDRARRRPWCQCQQTWRLLPFERGGSRRPVRSGLGPTPRREGDCRLSSSTVTSSVGVGRRLRGGERPPALSRRGRPRCASTRPSRWHNRQPRARPTRQVGVDGEQLRGAALDRSASNRPSNAGQRDRGAPACTRAITSSAGESPPNVPGRCANLP